MTREITSLTPEIIFDQLCNLGQIVFEVTDACNLKCSYCGYGDIYWGHDERKSKNLSFASAVALIDYMVDIWKNNPSRSANQLVYISFYGGEPLMNMPLVKQIVEYVEALPDLDRQFRFSMTTNAVLLNKYMDSFVCHLLPGYTGHNEGFFEKFVFVDEHDIRLTALEKREIFAHQVINTFFWGNLIIDCDGEIYANMNHPPIGTTDTPLSILLNREISESGSSWKMIRDRKPCMDCIYQYLCPSPSNYELIMNRPNLCSVWKNDGKILV